MRFAQMSGGERYAKEVAALSGGLNTQVPPEFLDDRELSDCLNVYWKEGALRTRPALHVWDHTDVDHGAVVATFETVDSEYLFVKTERYLLVYGRNGEVLNHFLPGDFLGAEQHVLFTESADGTVWLFLTETLNGKVVRQSPFAIHLNGDTAEITTLLEEYVPLVFINGRGSTDRLAVGSGRMYEGFNLLTPQYRALWTSDGESTWFSQPFAVGSGPFSVEYTHTDGAVYSFTASVESTAADTVAKSKPLDLPDVGEVYLQVSTLGNAFAFCNADTHSPVALPEVGVTGNVAVRAFRKTADVTTDRDAIYGMSFSTWFGGDNSGRGGGTRLFLGGNAKAPHLVRYSDVNNPLYFPENNFFYVGDRAQAVTAFGKQNGMLVVFKERELYCCDYAYRAVEDEELIAGEVVDVTTAAFFPLRQLHPAVGCDLPQTVRLCGNRLVWANTDGAVYMLSALNAWSEKAVRCISYAVAPTLKGKLSTASAVRYHGYYLLVCGDEVFLFDTMTGGFTGFTSYADERRAGDAIPWYRWRFPFAVSVAMGRDDAVTLFVTDAEGLHAARLGDGAQDDGVPIESRIVTKPFTLSRSVYRKSVYALWLQLAHTGAAVQVSVFGDGVDAAPAAYIAQTVSGDDGDFSPTAIPCRQTRVRTLGVAITATEPLALAGITMEFRTLGAVR